MYCQQVGYLLYQGSVWLPSTSLGTLDLEFRLTKKEKGSEG
jgi:hypothetical protein